MPRTLRVPAALTALALATSAAMMLPTLVPAASPAVAVGRSAAGFVGGYATVWAATGLVAHTAADVLSRAGAWLAAGAAVRVAR